MSELNPIESKILTYLLKRESFATTAKVARGARISWNTAEIYLKEFYKKGWVDVRKRGRTIYWRAIRK
tara:strand:- start:603 stop:806 length:204 start_codon:yes stop_codon:yes gene_type:complete